MSEANIGVVQEAFKRFSEGDLPGFLNLCTDDIKWDHRGPNSPLNKLYTGKEGIKEFLGTLSTTQEVIEFEPREYFSNGDRVVALGHFRFKVIETGNEWASDFAMAYTVTGGLISHWRGIFDMTAESIAYQS
tara:strand:- start:53 stop:448 length:396 start_codon:yes stop_codon:yes gene_type:complete